MDDSGLEEGWECSERPPGREARRRWTSRALPSWAAMAIRAMRQAEVGQQRSGRGVDQLPVRVQSQRGHGVASPKGP